MLANGQGIVVSANLSTGMRRNSTNCDKLLSYVII
jgi:hypothetical protein